MYTENLSNPSLNGARLYVRSSDEFIEYEITVTVIDTTCLSDSIIWPVISPLPNIIKGQILNISIDDLTGSYKPPMV